MTISSGGAVSYPEAEAHDRRPRVAQIAFGPWQVQGWRVRAKPLLDLLGLGVKEAQRDAAIHATRMATDRPWLATLPQPPGSLRRGELEGLTFDFRSFGAGEGIRTLDPNLGKVSVASSLVLP